MDHHHHLYHLKYPIRHRQDELKSETVKLNREVKTLKQKLTRRETKIGNLANLIDDLKEKCLIDQNTENKFSRTKLELIKNELVNQKKDPKGRRYASSYFRNTFKCNEHV